MKPLSRKPFVLMLKDDAGELEEVRLDPDQVNSDNAIIVLDEYNDTCWVWIGRNVNMPTRMHALRMSKSLQKAGHAVGATTIGRSLSRLIEIMEKDDSDPDVAANIAAFREMLGRKWSFDDNILAFDPKQASQYEAKPVEIVDTTPTRSTPPTSSEPEEPVEVVATDAEPVSKPRLMVTTPSMIAEKKAAFLLYSTIKNTDIVYVEKIERNGVPGMRLEAPGIMVVEALLEGNEINISPSEFGDNEQAQEIKKTYESWLKRL